MVAWGRVMGMMDWAYNPNRAMLQGDFGEPGEWAIGRTPVLGGYAYAVDEPGGGRIVGCRLFPPIDDADFYIRTRRVDPIAADSAGENEKAEERRCASRGRVKFTDTSYARPREPSPTRRRTGRRIGDT